jgi:hypothetical protein
MLASSLPSPGFPAALPFAQLLPMSQKLSCFEGHPALCVQRKPEFVAALNLFIGFCICTSASDRDYDIHFMMHPVAVTIASHSPAFHRRLNALEMKSHQPLQLAPDVCSDMQRVSDAATLHMHWTSSAFEHHRRRCLSSPAYSSQTFL